MSNNYYVNTKSTTPSNGEYEMHTDDCILLPKGRVYIGNFENDLSAITSARKLLPNKVIDGCYFCCNSVHTM